MCPHFHVENKLIEICRFIPPLVALFPNLRELRVVFPSTSTKLDAKQIDCS